MYKKRSALAHMLTKRSEERKTRETKRTEQGTNRVRTIITKARITFVRRRRMRKCIKKE